MDEITKKSIQLRIGQARVVLETIKKDIADAQRAGLVETAKALQARVNTTEALIKSLEAVYGSVK